MKGVYFETKRNKYCARETTGDRKFIGYFDNLDDAIGAYIKHTTGNYLSDAMQFDDRDYKWSNPIKKLKSYLQRNKLKKQIDHLGSK